jgi:hypothetical protein
VSDRRGVPILLPTPLASVVPVDVEIGNLDKLAIDSAG